MFKDKIFEPLSKQQKAATVKTPALTKVTTVTARAMLAKSAVTAATAKSKKKKTLYVTRGTTVKTTKKYFLAMISNIF